MQTTADGAAELSPSADLRPLQSTSSAGKAATMTVTRLSPQTPTRRRTDLLSENAQQVPAIPREAREHPTAQPFEERPADRKDEHARRACWARICASQTASAGKAASGREPADGPAIAKGSSQPKAEETDSNALATQ
jgi:hypothetical protein